MTTSTPTAPAIHVAGLTKSYDDHAVLRGVDLTVEPGTVFALLGPNGAGKTTTVNILTTLIGRDGGDVSVLGHDPAVDPRPVRAGIGVTGQFSAVDGLFSGRENLRLMADLWHLDRRTGRARTEELVERFDLVEAAGKPASTYSGGMRRRLDLAMTLMGRPRLIFLDEPTTGLDPRSRREMWAVIDELVADGATIFLTTQYLEEADQLADRIAVLNDGRVAAEGTAAELKRQVPGGHVRLEVADLDALRALHAIVPDATLDDDSLSAIVTGTGVNGVDDVRTLLNRLDHVAVTDLTIHAPDLDDVFLALTDQKVSA